MTEQNTSGAVVALPSIGDSAVLAEILMYTGRDAIAVMLNEQGDPNDFSRIVFGVASIFTYRMQRGLDRLREAGVRNHSLCNLDALVEVAAAEGYIRPEDKARLLAFRDNPADESWMRR